MKRFEDYGSVQRQFLRKAYYEGVRLDDPMASPGRIARLQRDELIEQRTSKHGYLNWRTTETGTALLRTEKDLPYLPANERDGVKRDSARRRKGRNKTRTQIITTPLLTDEAIATIDYWRKQRADTLFVYFIQEANDGPIKIGEAVNPVKRLESMQCGNPRELKIMAVVLAGRTTEWQLHGYWRSSAWIRGEWFARGQQPAILAKAQQIADAQIQAHKERAPIDDVCEKVFVRELFAEMVPPAVVV